MNNVLVFNPGHIKWNQFVSPHLGWNELACHDANRTPYPFGWRVNRGMPLAYEFEFIREMAGDRPVSIGSGFRTEEHNKVVGGARHSQHKKGLGLDLYPPGEMSVYEFHGIVLERSRQRNSRIKGIGLYYLSKPQFVHVDIRESKRLVHWLGRRKAAELKIAA